MTQEQINRLQELLEMKRISSRSKLYYNRKFEVFFSVVGSDCIHNTFLDSNDDLKMFLQEDAYRYLRIILHGVSIYEWSSVCGVLEDVHKINKWVMAKMAMTERKKR